MTKDDWKEYHAADTGFTFHVPPSPVGYFTNGAGMVIPVTVKPNWFVRLNYRICFGWKWQPY